MSNDLNATMAEWNGFGFKLARQSDYPAVLSHLKENYYHDEPMNQILGLTPARVSDLDNRITNILHLNHGTIYAYPMDQPEKIAAVLIIWNQEKGIELSYFDEQSPLTGLVAKPFLKLMERYDIHEERGLHVYPELYIISTDRQYRGKGLATKMYSEGIAKVKSEGYGLMSSLFTNPFSRKIGEKLGFKPVSRVDLIEIKNDDGSLVFGHAGKDSFIIESILELS